VEDSWKLSPSLTLNWGTGYEVFPFPWIEKYDRQANFLPSRGDVFTVNPRTSRATGTTTDKNNFGPRLGWMEAQFQNCGARGLRVFYQGESVPETNLPSQNPPFVGSSGFNNNTLADPSAAREAIARVPDQHGDFLFLPTEPCCTRPKHEF